MIIKIKTPKKGGSIKDRLDYLLERDPSTVSVLHRDLPESTLMSYDRTIPRKTRYYMGIVGFSAEEYARLSKEDKQKLLGDVLTELFRGYRGGNRPPVHIVEHRDTSAVHWHITIVNDLNGKDSRFWFPKRDLDWLASVQDYLNRKYNLDNPRERLRDTKKYFHGRYSAIFDKNVENRSREYLRRRLYALTEDIIRNHLVQDRDGLVRYLREELGLNVVREGKRFITIQVGKKKIRLRGKHYERGATYSGESPETAQGYSGTDGSSLEELQRRIIELGYRRYRALGKVSAQVVASLPHSGSGDRPHSGMEDAQRYLSALRNYLSASRKHGRKSVYTGSARQVKEEKWRQLSQLASTREHEDLLQKTARLAEELAETLQKKSGFTMPDFTFHIEKDHDHERGMSL